ncbi:hypothetical protein GCM10008955_39470 [Deinococcus malanensis]|uniref:Uncharacterized protein n=1 Tax=Deinococcus malanensis TaxID=1706855 RepID=A0ABQ2F1L6_9DEIO|nr:hypothetical protein [Deinococcus malanensis]GGK41769.1 hypothetical protein GCM10008955_39470 [Deinococcus malanensis]
MCSWHNNKARDGIRFTLSSTQMLQLKGYMTGELAASFRLRLPSPYPFAVLYYSESAQGWTYQDLAEDHLDTWDHGLAGEPLLELYVVIERVGGPQIRHQARAAHLPVLAT